MSGDTKRVLEVNQIDNLQGSTQRVKQETTLNNLRGITQRVYVVGGGSAPVIDELNVTPSTSAQTITAPEGTDGYSPVNVAAVTSSIDANIVAGNIKKDIEILGVTGSYEGQIPTGTMYIISNGTYNVADKAIANVQVPTTAPSYYLSFEAENNALKRSAHLIDFSNITTINEAYLFAYAYQNVLFPANTSIDMGNIQTLTGGNCFESMFSGAAGIISADLSSLTTISASYSCKGMFSGTGLVSIDISNLTTISGSSVLDSMVRNTSVKNITFNNLTSVSGTTVFANFATGSSLETLSFPKLSSFTQLASTYSPVAANCNKLESVSFGGVKASTFANTKNQIAYLFNSNTGSQATGGCTVHFPSNFDPSDPDHTFDASTLTGYPTFGGSSSYIHVAFDLPATE